MTGAPDTSAPPRRIGFLILKASTGAGGLETYELEIVRAIARADTHNHYHVVCADPVDPAVFAIDQSNFTFHTLRPRSRVIGLAYAFPRLAAALRLDVFHVTFVPPLWAPCPYIFTAHGPEMFVNPRFYPLAIRIRMNALIRHAYRRAAHILTVSASTRDFLHERFRVPHQRMTIVYNGVNLAFRAVPKHEARAAVKDRWGITDPFALFVGRVEPRKNPVRVLEAFALCRERLGPGFRLVIAGDKTWSAADVDAAIARLGLAPHITELGHIPITNLPALYSAAEMLVYPSLWEGFGLPIIEAMACDTPVITANVSSMPEVAGDAALLVDPLNPAAIAEAMVTLATDAALVDRLRALGRDRAAHFSWDAAARQTIDAFLRIAAQRSPRAAE